MIRGIRGKNTVQRRGYSKPKDRRLRTEDGRGLLRRFAPRNDGGVNPALHLTGSPTAIPLELESRTGKEKIDAKA